MQKFVKMHLLQHFIAGVCRRCRFRVTYGAIKREKQGGIHVSDEKSHINLREPAGLCADIAGTKVVFDIPDKSEAAGYSKVNIASMDNQKLKDFAWRPETDIRAGILKMVKILRE